jgi:hypothetical protein
MKGLIPENALSWTTTGKTKKGREETIEKEKDYEHGRAR